MHDLLDGLSYRTSGLKESRCNRSLVENQLEYLPALLTKNKDVPAAKSKTDSVNIYITYKDRQEQLIFTIKNPLHTIYIHSIYTKTQKPTLLVEFCEHSINIITEINIDI